MKLSAQKLDKALWLLTITAVLFSAIVGISSVLFEIRPFGLDEWFIIYNLKTKTAPALLGKLDLMQQFPRIYLVLVKWFTAAFNYSYFSLRLPAFLVSLLVMALCMHLAKVIFGIRVWQRYLLILFVISSYPFTEYMVQSKQYTMDLLAVLVALWQVIEFWQLRQGPPMFTLKYLLLCLSCIVVPFFSYEYPMAIAPVFFLAFPRLVSLIREKSAQARTTLIIMIVLPLLLSAFSLAVFYVFDVKQLMADSAMYTFWSFLSFDRQHPLSSSFNCGYRLFAQWGAGDLFENIVGVLGCVSFPWAIRAIVRNYRLAEKSLPAQLLLYSCLVLVVAFVLFFAGKLPLGNPRLNTFTLPAVAMLIINLLTDIDFNVRRNFSRLALPALLCVGLAGNVFTAHINYFLSDEHKIQMAVYLATEKAIKDASQSNLPMLVTSGLSQPYEVGANPGGEPEPITWLVKTFPAYDMRLQIPIYGMNSMADLDSTLPALPATVSEIIVGDGLNYKICTRGALGKPPNP